MIPLLMVHVRAMHQNSIRLNVYLLVWNSFILTEVCIDTVTGIPQGYCGFVSRPLQQSEYCNGLERNLQYRRGILVLPPKSGIAGSFSNCTFSFLRNLHTVFHSGCANHVRELHSPRPRQQLLFVFSLMITDPGSSPGPCS